MTLRITFDNKGNATLMNTDGERASLECDFSSPPGSPLKGQLVQSGHRVELKVHGCSRVSVEAQQFVIRGRWVNLSKLAKAEIVGSVVEPGGPAKA